jgi:hypothetical protein
MKLIRVIASAAILLSWCTAAGAELTDPYAILAMHYEALGGLDKLKAQRTSHTNGTISIEGTGMGGTFVEWSRSPILSRQEVDLGVFKQVGGDNGEHAWSVDLNGKLQIHLDERTLRNREVSRLMAEYAHLDRDNEHFTLTFEGIDTAAGTTCYAVKITNDITEDVVTQYIDTTSLLLQKTIAVTLNGESHALSSDYRDVDGVLMPFLQVTTEYPTGMVQRVEITSVDVNIDIDPALFEPPSQDVEDFRFANGKSVENLPFEFIDGHIYLPLTVGGRTRLWVLDSGAGVTCLEQKFTNVLGLEEEATMKGRGAGNLVDIAWVKMPAFSLTGLEFDGQTAASLDLAGLFERWVGLEVAGILGYDFLSRLVIKVDYANELLSFYHPDSFQYEGDGHVLEAPVSQDNMFHLPLTVDGEYGGKWNLDLGAGGMSFHYPFVRDHRLLERPGIDGVGHGAGGASPRKKVLFKTIEFADYTVADPVISLPTEEGEGAFASGELTGNIGNTLLRHFVLFMDYKREQVIVEKGKDFDKVFPRDNSGMQVENSSGELVVYFVAKGTPADKAGFEVGDVIIAVNGIEAVLLDGVVAFKKLLRDDPGTEYEVMIRRGEQSKKLELKLRDLYG